MLTARSSIRLAELVLPQVVSEFPAPTELEGSVSYVQKPVTCRCSELN